jgi:hypothetical protein
VKIVHSFPHCLNSIRCLYSVYISVIYNPNTYPKDGQGSIIDGAI